MLKTEWAPAHPSNYTRGRGGRKIKYLTIHHMADKPRTLKYLWGDPDRNGSSTWGVFPTKIEQYLDEGDTPWTNGNYRSNQESLTVEVWGDWRGGFTDTRTLSNLKKLMAEVKRKYPSIKINYHKDVSDKFTLCPAELRGHASKLWREASVSVRGSTKKIEPKKVILIRDANVWDLSFTSFSSARPKKALPSGTVVDTSEVYSHPLGPKYYISNYSIKNKLNHGININDTTDFTQPRSKHSKVKHSGDDSSGLIDSLLVDPSGQDYKGLLRLVKRMQRFIRRKYG